MNCLPESELLDLAFERLGRRPSHATSGGAGSHVERCPACKARLVEYTGMLAGVKKRLDETPPDQAACLDDEIIAAYMDDKLDAPAREEAEAHFASCQNCLRQLRELAQCMEDLEDSPGQAALTFVVEVGRRVLRMLATPDEGFSPAEQAPAPALAPDDTQHVLCWTQRVDELELELRLVRVDDTHVSLRVAGTAGGPSLAGVRFNLRSGDDIVQSEPIPEDGAFMLHGLEIAPYALEFRLPRPVVLHLNLRPDNAPM